MIVKLGELAAARAGMIDSGEWRQGDFERSKIFVRAGERVVVQGNANYPHVENLAGIVAMHNAADVLLDIAQAALAWRDAHHHDDWMMQDVAAQRLYDLVTSQVRS